MQNLPLETTPREVLKLLPINPTRKKSVVLKPNQNKVTLDATLTLQFEESDFGINSMPLMQKLNSSFVRGQKLSTTYLPIKKSKQPYKFRSTCTPLWIDSPDNISILTELGKFINPRFDLKITHDNDESQVTTFLNTDHYLADELLRKDRPPFPNFFIETVAPLYIRNVPENTCREDIEILLAPYGETIRIDFVGDGCAVYMRQSHAEFAEKDLNGKTFGEHPLVVTMGLTVPMRRVVEVLRRPTSDNRNIRSDSPEETENMDLSCFATFGSNTQTNKEPGSASEVKRETVSPDALSTGTPPRMSKLATLQKYQQLLLRQQRLITEQRGAFQGHLKLMMKLQEQWDEEQSKLDGDMNALQKVLNIGVPTFDRETPTGFSSGALDTPTSPTAPPTRMESQQERYNRLSAGNQSRLTAPDRVLSFVPDSLDSGVVRTFGESSSHSSSTPHAASSMDPLDMLEPARGLLTDKEMIGAWMVSDQSSLVRHAVDKQVGHEAGAVDNTIVSEKVAGLVTMLHTGNVPKLETDLNYEREHRQLYENGEVERFETEEALPFEGTSHNEIDDDYSDQIPSKVTDVASSGHHDQLGSDGGNEIATSTEGNDATSLPDGVDELENLPDDESELARTPEIEVEDFNGETPIGFDTEHVHIEEDLINKKGTEDTAVEDSDFDTENSPSSPLSPKPDPGADEDEDIDWTLVEDPEETQNSSSLSHVTGKELDGGEAQTRTKIRNLT